MGLYMLTNDLEGGVLGSVSWQKSNAYSSTMFGVGPFLNYYIARTFFVSANYQHYFILCILPLTILLCAALTGLSRRITLPLPVFRIVTIVLLCAASLPLIRFFRDNYMPRTPSSYPKTRDYLLNETVADEPILVCLSFGASA